MSLTGYDHSHFSSKHSINLIGFCYFFPKSNVFVVLTSATLLSKLLQRPAGGCCLLNAGNARACGRSFLPIAKTPNRSLVHKIKHRKLIAIGVSFCVVRYRVRVVSKLTTKKGDINVPFLASFIFLPHRLNILFQK